MSEQRRDRRPFPLGGGADAKRPSVTPRAHAFPLRMEPATVSKTAPEWAVDDAARAQPFLFRGMRESQLPSRQAAPKKRATRLEASHAMSPSSPITPDTATPADFGAAKADGDRKVDGEQRRDAEHRTSRAMDILASANDSSPPRGVGSARPSARASMPPSAGEGSAPPAANTASANDGASPVSATSQAEATAANASASANGAPPSADGSSPGLRRPSLLPPASATKADALAASGAISGGSIAPPAQRPSSLPSATFDAMLADAMKAASNPDVLPIGAPAVALEEVTPRRMPSGGYPRPSMIPKASATEHPTAEMLQARAELVEAITDLALARERAVAELEPEVLDLAVFIASAVLEEELTVRPELHMRLVRSALAALSPGGTARIRASRASYQALVDHYGSPRVDVDGVRLDVTLDAALEGYGVMVEREAERVDGRIGPRLERVRKALADARRAEAPGGGL